MGMTKFQILKLFHEKILSFLNALITRFPNEQDLLQLRVLFTSTIPIEKAMELFSKRIIPYETMVNNENEEFFLEGTDIFEGIKGDKINYFKKLWLSPDFTEEDKKELWRWFKLFLILRIIH